ncbi:MAG: RluA family pseudouridine synthase [Lachnospiraceae bacterium]|nr:RluA family pseudouridine synthase [Lachnospiraceae bacterium]
MTKRTMTPEIIYEDDAVMVVYKPAGMATQTRLVSEMDLEMYLKNHRAQAGEDNYIGIIQRLDQPVEGVLVVAKTKAAAENLTKQLREHTLGKHYYALITRNSLPKSGTLEDYLVKDTQKGRAKVVSSKDPRAKKARLEYEVIRERGGQRLVDVCLDTGRYHQIRVQFASRTAPLIGDIKYGGISTGHPLCLCGYRTEFVHPVTQEPMHFEITPKGEEFVDFFAE